MDLAFLALDSRHEAISYPGESKETPSSFIVGQSWSAPVSRNSKVADQSNSQDNLYQLSTLWKTRSEPTFDTCRNGDKLILQQTPGENKEQCSKTLHPPQPNFLDSSYSPKSLYSSSMSRPKSDVPLTLNDCSSPSLIGSTEPLERRFVPSESAPDGRAGKLATGESSGTQADKRNLILLSPRPRTFYCREWVFDKILRHLKVSSDRGMLKTCLNVGELDTVTETATAVSGTVPKHSGQLGQGSQPSKKLVLVGGPGSGKTTICRRIVSAQQQARNIFESGHSVQSAPLCVQVSAHLLATHLCTIQLQDSLSPVTFIRSVKHQILSSPFPLATKFAQLIESNKFPFSQFLSFERIRTSPDEAFRYGILAALSAAVDEATKQRGTQHSPSPNLTFDLDPSETMFYPGIRQLFFLVDGVDDCASPLAQDNPIYDLQRILTGQHSDKRHGKQNSSTESQGSKTILELLVNNMQHFPDWLTLFITCRRQNRNVISRTFNGIRRITIDDLHRSAVSHDVQQYLLSRLAAEKDLQFAFRAHMHSDFFGLLRIKSSACLLYLETILDALGELWVKPEQLAFIPGTLNGLYLWLCQRIFSPSSTTSHMSCPTYFPLVRPLLEVILATRQPISERELYEILSTVDPSFSYNDFCGRLKLLRTVLVHMTPEEERRQLGYNPTVSPDQNRSENIADKHIQFFHSSFAEWLLDVKHCTVAYLCDIEHGRSLIEHALEGQVYTERLVNEITTLPTLDDLSGPGDGNAANNHDRNESVLRQPVPEMERPLTDPIDSVYTHTNYTSDSLQLIEPDETASHTAGSRLNDSLVLAARKGEYDKIRLLLEKSVNVNQLDEDGWSALRTASWRGHMDIVELLLSYGADVNLSGPDGRSALRAASWAGHEEIVQRLLDAGADVNQQDAEGRSSLIAAAYMGHVGVVEILAQAGADLNHADEDGRTALHVAAFCVRPSETHHEVVSCLLECGANPNVFDCEGITPLLGAARAGNRTVCELCLEADTDVNQADKCGNTALTLAVLGGHTSVVRLLLFWGAAVDSMDPAGRSLLSLAASIGNGPIVQELLARGLDEAHRDHAGCTPLHLASAGRSSATSVNCETESTPEQYSEVIRILLESGAHAEDTDNAGRTPLLTACECNNLAAVEVLLTLSPTSSFNCHSPNHSDTLCSLASVDAPCVTGHPHASFGLTTAAGTSHIAVRKALNQPSLDNQTPLRAAALCNNPDLVRILLAAGADPDYQDAYGRTTLYLLALEGMLDMADLLLHTPAPGAHQRPGSSGLVGANPVLSDDEGRCPLHVATWQGHLDMVKLLLQAGTPVDIRDREGRTPLQLAAWQGHAAICQLLLEEGNARVDAVCSQGATSLCIAAQEGHAHVCSVLLQAGANPFQGDSHGRTPYRVALKAGHVDICKLLEQRYGSNNPSWFDPDGICGCEPVTPEMHPHRATNDPVHGPVGPGLGTRVHPRSTGQDVSRGPEANPTQVLSSAQPPSILDGSHFHPLPHQHQHNHHVPVRRDYGDDANPYARPPGPMAVHGFQQPSSDNSSYSETPNGHPSMCIQPRSRMNSSGNPTSYLYSDSFAQTDFGHPHPNHSGQWQYNTSAAYAPISELRPGVLIPITNYSRQVEPPTYDPVHPGAFHLPLERTTSQALHFQPNSFGQQIPTQLVGQPVDTNEALLNRVSPAVVNLETRNLPIQQPLDPDSRIAIDSQWTKPSQHQHQPHHHHHHHHYPHPKGVLTAAVPHHSLRNEVRDADIDPRERLVVQTTKFQNPVGEIPRPAHSRLLQESPKCPDLLTNPFNQVHMDRGRGDKTTSAASAVSPHNASAVMKTTKISASALSVTSSVRDPSQMPRHRNEPPQPPLVPQHVTGATTSSTHTTTVTTSVSLAPQSEPKKFREDRLVLREVPVQASPNPASRQESKTSTAKSTLAGMLLFGNRKGKKSRKQPSDSPEMVTQLNPGSFVSGGNGIPGVPLRTKLKPTSQPRTGRPTTAGDDPKVDRLPYANQSDRPACLEGHRIKTSPTTATPSGHDFPDRGVTSSMQLEALARKFACCTQTEGVPSSNAAFVSRSQMTPSKPYSPQLWDRQSLRNDSGRQQM